MYVRRNEKRQRGRGTVGSDEIAWSDFVAAVAEMIAPLARAAEALAKYGKMSAEDIVFWGYAPIEYARMIGRREIIREMFRPAGRRYFCIFQCSLSVPGMVRKRGRVVKRGGIE